MNGIYQHYIIDMSSNNNFVQVPTIQGDGNKIRGIEIELIQNGTRYIVDKDDTFIFIMGTKPDNGQIMNPCAINENGYILIDITSQMSAVKGRGSYQVVMMSKSTNSQLKSFPFHIITVPSAFDIDYIISSDEFQALTQNIARTEDVIKDANGAISDIRELEASVENSEAGRTEAETSRNHAESARETAESARITNENNRRTNETDRQTSEEGRVSAENSRANAESARISDENTRISNENRRKGDESVRQENEDSRNSSETARRAAENRRNEAENSRAAQEDIRASNENQRNTEENKRAAEETKRDNAEKIRITNETTRKNNESTRQSNESLRQSNTTAAINRANSAAKACENIVAGTDLVMSAEKGTAGGVATLDGSGKLTGSQLPISTTGKFGAVKTGANITNTNGTISVSNANVINAIGFIPISSASISKITLVSSLPSDAASHPDTLYIIAG